MLWYIAVGSAFGGVSRYPGGGLITLERAKVVIYRGEGASGSPP